MTGTTMTGIIRATAIISLCIGLYWAMNENPRRIYINFIGAGLASIGTLILHMIGSGA